MSLLKLHDNNFKDEVLDSNHLVLVDFWAEWCGPCKMINPALEELAKEYSGKVKIGKVNVDENQKLPTQYGIMSIPTLILFKNGTIQEQITGALSKAQLKKVIEVYL